MAFIRCPKRGIFVFILACAMLTSLILPGRMLSRTSTKQQAFTQKNGGVLSASASNTASSPTTTITRGLWAGEKKTLIALSLDNGQAGLLVPAQHLEDIAVDNDRRVVWAGTKTEIIQYNFDGVENFRYALKAGAHHEAAKKDGTSRTHKDDDKEQNDEDREHEVVRLSLDPTNGSLWIATGNDVIKLSFDSTELFTITEPDQGADISVDVSDGTCWVGQKHSITKYTSDGTPLLTFVMDNDHKVIALAAEASSHSLWIGTTKGIIKYDTHGTELFRITELAHIQDLKTNSANDDLWIVTTKKAHKYSKEGQELLAVSLRPKDEGHDHEKRLNSEKSGNVQPTCGDGNNGHDTDDDKNCAGDLITLAVDPNDNSCWAATSKTLYKLSDTGEQLLKLSGFKQIEALDIGQSGKGPELLLCPESYLEQQRHPPTPGCAQQALIGRLNWSRGYIFGQVTNEDETIILDGITLNQGSKIYNQGRIYLAEYTGTFFWAHLLLYGPDGSYPVTVTVTNDQGRTVTSTVTFIKDTVSPNVIISSPLDGTITKEQTITITGTVDDPTATLQLDLDGSNIPVVNSAFSYLYNMGSVEGPQYIWITATDPARNSSGAYLTIIHDTTPPQLTITSPVDGMITNNQTLNITGTVFDDNPDSVTVTVNGGQPQQLTLALKTFNGAATLNPNHNTFTFQAKDKAGNIAAPITRTVILDQEPPTVAITSPLPNASLAKTITASVVASDSIAGVANVTILIDGKTYTSLTQAPYNFEIDTLTLTPGAHTITARVMDNATNQSETAIPVTIQKQLAIEITSPASGATINKSMALVQGRINPYTNKEVGVTINGVVAHQNGNNFAVLVPLQTGQNTITAVISNAYGIKKETAITINTETINEYIRLTVNPESGIPITKPDGTTSFDSTLEAEASLPNPIANYSWDTNGDGVIDQTGPALTTITAGYQTSGMYFPTVTITDSAGNTYTETAVVNVLDRASIDALLKAKWEGMKTAIVGGDIETALTYINEIYRDRYQQAFTELGSDQINSRFSNIIDLKLDTLYGRVGQCWAVRLETGGTFAYPVIFVKNGNGIWQIREF